MVRAAQVHAVLVAESDPPGAVEPSTARRQNQTVTDEAAERVARIAEEGGRDEQMAGAGE